MIVLKVIGGLGNQMFQVAFARVLSLENNEDIYLDCSSYKKYKIRNFSINNLHIEDKLKYTNSINLPFYVNFYLKITQKLYHIFQKIIIKYRGTICIGQRSYTFLSRLGLYYNFDVYYYKTLFKNNKVKCIYGYFQSEEYFKKYSEQIKQELRVKTPLTQKESELYNEIIYNNSVGVSIRIGDDYRKSPILNVCTENYYYKAMDYIFEKENDVVFYIFSDCPDKVKEIFDFKYPVKYIEGFKDYEGLRLLYSCKHFVISNSSFSWWGAYLSENINKIIIAPSRWYNNSKIKEAIYYDGMTIIDG